MVVGCVSTEEGSVNADTAEQACANMARKSQTVESLSVVANDSASTVREGMFAMSAEGLASVSTGV